MMGLVVFLFLIALIYTVGCHVTITNLVTIIIALVLGVSCLLTLSVNQRDVILNNTFFSFTFYAQLRLTKCQGQPFFLNTGLNSLIMKF
jgi:hypothetical protein